jgi:general secretion pathway protein B
MSLILEALKKSEQQRRLGEMPNLGTPITATRRRRNPMPWLAAVAIVALAAVGGWRLLRPPPGPIAGESAPIKAATKPEATAAPAPRQALKPAPSALPQQVAAPPPAAPVAAPAPPKKEAAPPPVPSPAALPVTARAAAEAHALVPAPPVPAAPVAAPAPAVSDVPTLDDLPPNLRSALPELPITMQVYSPDPKRRFVIIDGTRVVEGDSLRGVTVYEIRPNGLVLEFQGRRVLLPRPGS